MKHERGLPTVPRGLSRELTTYLQALQNVVLSLSGLGRGSDETRAARLSDVPAQTSRALRKGEVLTANLADGSVSADKLADDCVTEKKLAPSAVTGRAIKGGEVGRDALSAFCVSNDKLANGSVNERVLQDACVTREKLSADCRPIIIEGEAEDGELVFMEDFAECPLLALTGYELEIAGNGILRLGIEGLIEKEGVWSFTASARFTAGENIIKGHLYWRAYGLARQES